VLTRLLRPAHRPAPAAIPGGRRLYAIGDVHGRLDLLDALLAKIDADDAARGPADRTIIFLGDLIDRGPDSAGVVERVYRLAQSTSGVRVLMGNHEEVFARAISGDVQALRHFCTMGGRETLLSYGIGAADYAALDYSELLARLQQCVPGHHQAFINGFENLIEIGSYAFVHAGIRPGVPLAEQQPADLRWIRDIFLNHQAAFERIIVHGHTISARVDEQPNRIGIDTGAYTSGCLTALGLETTRRWYVNSTVDGAHSRTFAAKSTS
jgi:serine/threonine protein phosphatase 1